jgi:hypothetical protein
MEKPARPAPSLIPALLALLILIAIGYVLFADLQPSRTEHTVSPPLELEEPVLETVTIEGYEPTPERQQVMEEEAAIFVDELAPTPEEQEVVTVTEAQGEFVRHDGTIAIPRLEHRTTTIGELQQDKTLAADTPLTLHFIEQERTETSLEQLAKDSDDHQQIITIEHSDGSQVTASLAELLKKEELDIAAAVTLIKEQNRTQQLTAGELANTDIDVSQQVTATINHGSEELSVKDIIKTGELPDNALFYLHRVTEADIQGLWGIIQQGLIHRFRQGLSLEGIASNRDLVRVTIPADADEPLPTGLSSFLGRILSQKVESSYIYNFSTQTMGHDPNLIHPGQQLILIHFKPNELKRIYLFFAEQRDEQAQSFAIQP